MSSSSIVMALLGVLERFGFAPLGLLPWVTSMIVGLSFSWGFWENRHPRCSRVYQQRKDIFYHFVDFVVRSGCSRDMWQGLFHWNVCSNMWILNKIHRRLYLTEQAKERLGKPYRYRSSTTTSTHTITGEENDASQQQEATNKMWQETARLLNYSSAVYGQHMVAASELESAVHSKTNNSTDRSLLQTYWTRCEEPQKQQQQDIVVSNTGGSMEYSSHMIWVDHEHKQIVLAVRGSMCMSDLFRVLQATAVPFYGGLAHEGCANLARGTWKKATSSIDFGTVAPPEYEFVLTGHSLGASVAMLMTIMIQREELVMPKIRKVRCVAFAPLAALAQLDAVQDILPQITAIVHGNDFVSIDCIHQWRILNESIAVIERERQDMTSLQVLQLLCGWREPSEWLVQQVAAILPKLKPILPEAPRLALPAGKVIHLNRIHNIMQARELDAEMMTRRRPIPACSTWLSDHTIGMHQAALQEILQTLTTTQLSDYVSTKAESTVVSVVEPPKVPSKTQQEEVQQVHDTSLASRPSTDKVRRQKVLSLDYYQPRYYMTASALATTRMR